MRLEPTYLASIVIVIAIAFVASHTPGYAGAPFHADITQLALHLAYFIPWSGREWINPDYWSLAIEFQYYIAMIVLGPLLLSKSPWHRNALLSAAFLLSLLPVDDRLLFAYLPFFALGFLAFLRYHQRIDSAAFGLWLIAFAGLCIRDRNIYGMIAGVLTTAVIFVPLSRPVPLLSFLGTISYSIYLLHQPLADRIINLYARFGASDQLQIAAVATSVAVSIVAATALWWLVERPSATFGRVFLKRTDDRSSMTRYAPDIK